MKSFLKYLLASVLGVLFAGILLFFIMLGSIGVIVSSKEQPVKLKPNTVLVIDLKEKIIERDKNNPLNKISGFNQASEIGLTDILNNIKKAKTDPNVKGIYLNLTTIKAGIASIEEIRNALIDFKKSEKFIISYSDAYSQTNYYLSSVADKVYMNPEGILMFLGMRSELMFFKEALQKLGIEPQIIRHGKFKSAIEPLIYNKMSKANREQIETYMNSIWDHILKGISTEREISVEKLNDLANNLTLKNSKSAIDNGLVDGLKYKDEVLAELAELTDNEKIEKIESVSLTKYTKVPNTKRKFNKNKIAVVYANGSVIMGEGEEGSIGSDRISRAIRKARLDSTIKAIVFRVNSGGGSALASEVIWREVKLAQEVKPVIASLGDVAASGGYYIVAPAQKIVASPNTITGSIGVFGVLFNGQKLLNNKLGVHVDVVKTNTFADIGSFARKLTAQEREVIQYSIENTYDTFISHVAEGRNMTKEDIDKIGQGRVWSGENALEIGLIDQFGGLQDAINIAAETANLESYRIVNLPKLEDPFEKLIKELSGNVKASIIKKELGNEYKYYNSIQKLRNLQGVQARIPYEIEIY